MESNYSLADIGAVTGKENAGMSSGGMWVFALHYHGK
nr:MAG TPA: hypothetical protein [Caudoviricetes sp.]